MKNLSLEKSCSIEKLVVEVIPHCLIESVAEVILEGLKKYMIELVVEVIPEGDMSLKKDLIVEPNGQMEPNDKELIVTNRMKSCGKKNFELQKKEGSKQRQCADLKKRKRNQRS